MKGPQALLQFHPCCFCLTNEQTPGGRARTETGTQEGFGDNTGGPAIGATDLQDSIIMYTANIKTHREVERNTEKKKEREPFKT